MHEPAARDLRLGEEARGARGERSDLQPHTRDTCKQHARGAGLLLASAPHDVQAISALCVLQAVVDQDDIVSVRTNRGSALLIRWGPIDFDRVLRSEHVTYPYVVILIVVDEEDPQA